MGNGNRPTPEFRREAVRPALTSGRTRREITEDLGIGLSTLTRWLGKERDVGEPSEVPVDLQLVARREHAAPIIAVLKPWLETQLSRIPQKSQLAEDIRYTLAHWPGLIRFLEDGTLEMDTNPVENQIRPIALTRKNALFAGNEVGAENWAMLASLVATCKMSGVNPIHYLADTLRAILDGHPQSGIEDLMPWRFRLRSSLAA